MAIELIDEYNKVQGFGERKAPEDYTLFVASRENLNTMLSLGGHALKNVTVEDDPETPKQEPYLTNGKWKVRDKRTRGDGVKSISAQIVHPPNKQWSPMETLSEMDGECLVWFALPECQDGDCADHVLLFDELVSGEPRSTGVFTGFGEDGGVQDRLTPVFMNNAYYVYAVNSFNELAPGDNLYGAYLRNDRCTSGCSCGGAGHAIIGGGSASPLLVSTEDGFATTTTLASGVPAGSVITSVYWRNGLYVVGYADDPDPTASTAGGIRYSLDGTNWSDATDSAGVALANGIHKIVDAGRLIALGMDGELLESTNGQVWTAIANTVIPATADLANGAYDAGIVYIVGDDAGSGVAYTLDNRNQVFEITPQLTSVLAIPGGLFNVEAQDGHVQITGEFGVFYERFTPNAEWKVRQFGALITDVIQATAINGLFSYIGMGNRVFQRTPYTDFDWVEINFGASATLTGDVTDIEIVLNKKGFLERIYITGSAGELIIVDNCLPDVCALLQRGG